MPFRLNAKQEKEAYVADKRGNEIAIGMTVTYEGQPWTVIGTYVGPAYKIVDGADAGTVLIKSGDDERRVDALKTEIVAP